MSTEDRFAAIKQAAKALVADANANKKVATTPRSHRWTDGGELFPPNYYKDYFDQVDRPK